MGADRDLSTLVELSDCLTDAGAHLLRVYRAWTQEMARVQLGVFVQRHGREALEERAQGVLRAGAVPGPAELWWVDHVIRPLRETVLTANLLAVVLKSETSPCLIAAALLLDHCAQVTGGVDPPLFRRSLSRAKEVTVQDLAATSMATAVAAEMIKLLAPSAPSTPVADPERRDDAPPFDLGEWEGNTL